MEYTFTWYIENYSYCLQQNAEALVSPEFFVRGLEETAWRIRLYPRGSSAERKGRISLFLQRSNLDVTPELINLKFELALLGKDGSAVISKTLRHTFRRGEICGNANFLHMLELFLLHEDTLLPQDTLSVCCNMWSNEEFIPERVQGFARTRIAIENVSFLHIVEDFKKFKNAKITTWLQYSSREISMTSGVYLDDSSSDDIKLMVEIYTSNIQEVLLKCNLFLIDASENLVKCGEEDSRTDSERRDISRLCLSLTNEYILERDEEYLPDGDLIILCQCTFSSGVKYEKIEKTLYHIPAYISNRTNNDLMTENVPVCSSVSVINELKSLCDATLPKDVELKTLTNSFPAHKILLCARSPVFREKITKGMGGVNTEFITVHDLEDDTVENLLHFLYFDDLENLQWGSAMKLHYAAKAYAIPKLKCICSSFLIHNISEANVGELLLLGLANKDSDILKAANDFRHKFIFDK